MTNKRRLWNAAVRALVYAAAALTVLLLVGILGYVLYRGLPNVTPALLTQSDSVLKGTIDVYKRQAQAFVEYVTSGDANQWILEAGCVPIV